MQSLFLCALLVIPAIGGKVSSQHEHSLEDPIIASAAERSSTRTPLDDAHVAQPKLLRRSSRQAQQHIKPGIQKAPAISNAEQQLQGLQLQDFQLSPAQQVEEQEQALKSQLVQRRQPVEAFQRSSNFAAALPPENLELRAQPSSDIQSARLSYTIQPSTPSKPNNKAIPDQLNSEFHLPIQQVTVDGGQQDQQPMSRIANELPRQQPKDPFGYSDTGPQVSQGIQGTQGTAPQRNEAYLRAQKPDEASVEPNSLDGPQLSSYNKPSHSSYKDSPPSAYNAPPPPAYNGPPPPTYYNEPPSSAYNPPPPPSNYNYPPPSTYGKPSRTIYNRPPPRTYSNAPPTNYNRPHATSNAQVYQEQPDIGQAKVYGQSVSQHQYSQTAPHYQGQSSPVPYSPPPLTYLNRPRQSTYSAPPPSPYTTQQQQPSYDAPPPAPTHYQQVTAEQPGPQQGSQNQSDIQPPATYPVPSVPQGPSPTLPHQGSQLSEAGGTYGVPSVPQGPYHAHPPQQPSQQGSGSQAGIHSPHSRPSSGFYGVPHVPHGPYPAPTPQRPPQEGYGSQAGAQPSPPPPNGSYGVPSVQQGPYPAPTPPEGGGSSGSQGAVHQGQYDPPSGSQETEQQGQYEESSGFGSAAGVGSVGAVPVPGTLTNFTYYNEYYAPFYKNQYSPVDSSAGVQQEAPSGGAPVPPPAAGYGPPAPSNDQSPSIDLRGNRQNQPTGPSQGTPTYEVGQALVRDWRRQTGLEGGGTIVKRRVPDGEGGYTTEVIDEQWDDYPRDYFFKYDISGTPGDRTQEETGQGDRVVGRYEVKQPDGMTQVVEYTADESGYKPKVSYVESLPF